MKKLLPLLLLCAVFPACRPDSGKTPQKPSGDSSKGKAVMELVGTLRRPISVKHAYRLEIYPVGNLKVLEMIGDELRKIPDNTPVRVRGVVRSEIVGPAKDDPDQYPVQWGVWLRVSEVQTYDTVEEAFREARQRQDSAREKAATAK